MSSFYGGSGGGLSSEDLEAITSKIFKFEIVNALPENNISDSTIYLISTGEQEDNIYTEYIYINNHWEKFGTQKIDLTNYVTLEFFDEKLAAKQDNLTAGSNISITEVDGKFIISAVDTTYSNATSQTSGLMSSTDKTKIDGITAEKIQAWDAAEQNIQPDWLQNDNTADDYIKNKPNFALVTDVNNALAGKVDKETNKSLMSADEHTKLNDIEAGAQVNTVTGIKGNAENNYRTGEINISPANIGLGNVDNTSDANKPISTAAQTALDGKQDVLTFDNSPTENSDNPVKSGGVYTALSGKQDTLAFDATPQAGSTNPVTSNGIYTAIEGVSAVYVSSSQPAATAVGNDIWLVLRNL